MVFSLVNLSLISITNGIKDGKIQHPHLLPPTLRQLVLDTALRRSFVNDPNCLAVLSSIEFLSGMRSFSTAAGSIYDVALLAFLIKSMATLSPNGQTIGSAITKLSLSVYGRYAWTEDHRCVAASSFPTAAKLIAACPNLDSLDLRGVESDVPLIPLQYADGLGREPWFPSVLNEREPCNRVMENLRELSICCQIERRWTNRQWKVLGNEEPLSLTQLPIINFKRLTTLKLNRCSVQVDMWPEFLRKVPTLENLQMIDTDGVGEQGSDIDLTGLEWILPFPMPQLKSLQVISVCERRLFCFKCTKAFVDNLMECPNIREVSLMLDEKSVNEASMVCLSSMDVALNLKAYFRLTGILAANPPALDSSSRFKVISIFHERLDSFEFLVWDKWRPEFTTALKDVLSTCSNLTAFHLTLPISYRRETKIKSKREAKKVSTVLVRFFKEHGLQLQDLSLTGTFDEAVLLAVFYNCLNLRQLEISQSPTLRDQYLIDWVARGGGRLTDLSIFKCKDNVTSEGIIPILARSGESLLRVKVHGLDALSRRRWKAVAASLCPYVEIDPPRWKAPLNLPGN